MWFGPFGVKTTRPGSSETWPKRSGHDFIYGPIFNSTTKLDIINDSPGRVNTLKKNMNLFDKILLKLYNFNRKESKDVIEIIHPCLGDVPDM